MLAPLGCASSLRSTHPDLVTADSRAECKPLGRVRGEAQAEDRVMHDTQLYWATQQALDAAAAMGATHVVFDSEEDYSTMVYVSGTGYRCR
jgi:hypothetical protein